MAILNAKLELYAKAEWEEQQKAKLAARKRKKGWQAIWKWDKNHDKIVQLGNWLILLS